MNWVQILEQNTENEDFEVDETGGLGDVARIKRGST